MPISPKDLETMKEQAKGMVSETLQGMTKEQQAKAARLNQKIVDLFNSEEDNYVELAASFMSIETIAGGLEKTVREAIDKQMERNKGLRDD